MSAEAVLKTIQNVGEGEISVLREIIIGFIASLLSRHYWFLHLQCFRDLITTNLNQLTKLFGLAKPLKILLLTYFSLMFHFSIT